MADAAGNAANPTDSIANGNAKLDMRNTALGVLAVAAAVFLARDMKDVVIPLVLAGLLFYALDPFVDRLQRWRIPRVLGASLVLISLVGGLSGLAYSLRDETLAVVEELPLAARRLRASFARQDQSAPTALDKLQQAATEIERTAAEASSASSIERGVTRVQIASPRFSVADYLWWSSFGLAGVAGQAAIVLLLTFFLLLSDDLFKRKLVEIIGPTLTRKRITVQILNDIASQIERFLLVQILTSIIVAIATALALWWIELEHAIIWGIIAGVLNSIPYFGPLVVTAGLMMVAFLQFGTIGATLAVGTIALAITTMEGYFLTPVLMGRVAEMNKVALFAGLLFWSWLWGIPGMLLAVPLMMCLKAVCDRVDDLQPIGTLLSE